LLSFANASGYRKAKNRKGTGWVFCEAFESLWKFAGYHAMHGLEHDMIGISYDKR